MLSALEQLERIRDIAVNKMNEIIGRERASGTTVAEVATREVFEAPVDAMETAEAEGTPPEPEATKPRPVGRKGRNGEVNKSGLIREYFDKHPKARNQEVIEYVKEKYKIDLQPSLVSTVKIKMDIPKGKPGRVKGESAKAKPKATARAASKGRKKKDGMPMVACVTKVLSRSKSGLRVNDVVNGVKKFYDYGGEQGDKGLKNVVNQALYALSLKKKRRGWEGSAPVILHDDESHTWRINPKAKRIA